MNDKTIGETLADIRAELDRTIERIEGPPREPTCDAERTAQERARANRERLEWLLELELGELNDRVARLESSGADQVRAPYVAPAMMSDEEIAGLKKDRERLEWLLAFGFIAPKSAGQERIEMYSREDIDLAISRYGS